MFMRSPILATLSRIGPWVGIITLVVGGGYAALSGAVPAHSQANYDVTLIVVDDFTADDLSDVDPDDYDASDNCAVSLEGQAYAVRGVSADVITLPHGEIVYAQIEELLDDAGALDSIDLVQVDIHGLTTDDLAAALTDAIDDNPADYYVINMSFAILPCEYVQAFADYGSQLLDARDARDLNRYRNLFRRAVIFYDDEVFPAMSQAAQQATDLDPLQEALVDLRGTAMPVASAGNFGLDFPFWPAAWGQVISVSGSEGTGYYAPGEWDHPHDDPLLHAEVDRPGRSQRISNYGEVMMPGEYSNDDVGDVSGTSFAAPRLSVLLALYLADVGGSYCQDSDGDPALAYGDWDNLTLPQAVDDHCANLDAYLP